MLLMDFENLHAPGWSHVVSTSNDLSELEAFRERIGAPARALHLKNRGRPHLDLKLEPRQRALADPGVRVFPTTKLMLRYLHSLDGRAVGRSVGPTDRRTDGQGAG
jgi:hypothetical protein